MSTVTPSEAPTLYEPATLEQANRWIQQLREAYHREHDYVERLEAQIHREGKVVDIARYWHKARGMHRAPWLRRLKDAVVGLLEAEAAAANGGQR
jgi:hypothetical protein